MPSALSFVVVLHGEGEEGGRGAGRGIERMMASTVRGARRHRQAYAHQREKENRAITRLRQRVTGRMDGTRTRALAPPPR